MFKLILILICFKLVHILIFKLYLNKVNDMNDVKPNFHEHIQKRQRDERHQAYKLAALRLACIAALFVSVYFISK